MSRSKKFQTALAAICVFGSFYFLWHVRKKSLDASTKIEVITQSTKIEVTTLLEMDENTQEEMNPDSEGELFGVMPNVPVPMNIPGVTDVQVYESSKIDLADEAEVLVVFQNGNARAYFVEGMSDPETHVVHDMFENQPITVAYCDMTNNGRAFIRQDIKPEDFRMGGWSGKEMSMLIKGKQYNLSNPSVPLSECSVEMMNFGQFKKQFPDGEIYLGNYKKTDER